MFQTNANISKSLGSIIRTLRLDFILTTYIQMRAILIKDDKGPVENLYLGEVPKPEIRSDEVLVKVRDDVLLPQWLLRPVCVSRSRPLV